MAIDFHDLTAIADQLKNTYGQGITNQFVDEKTTYNQFPASGRAPRGLGYVFAIRYARAQGIGARSESQLLPDPLVGKFDQGTVSPKYIYGSLRLTGPMISAAKGDASAFVDGLADSVDDIYNGIVVDLNRQACSDGFGKLGVVTASDSLATGATWTVTYDNDLGVSRMVAGMVIDHYDGANVDQSSISSRISSIDPVTKIVTYEANDGTYKANHPIVAAQSYTVATDAVPTDAVAVRQGSREAAYATSDTPIEMTGLEGIYDDGTLLATFENITVASYPQWQANMLTNSSVNRELSLDLMLRACDVTRVQSGMRVEIMRMGLGQRRKYVNLLVPDVRYQAQELRGGYETLTFAAGDGSVEIVIDPALPPNKVFCEPRGVIQKYEMEALGWGALDQQMHQRAQYDEWDQFMRIYTNMGCEQRNCLTLIGDLTEPDFF